MASKELSMICNHYLPPSSKPRCFSQLSPCAPSLSSQHMSRCSSVSDPCPKSRLSCGSLSPISTVKEIKIIITDPQNNSVFSSVHDPYARAQQSQNSLQLQASSLFTSITSGKPWSRLVILIWAVLSPAFLGLFIGLIFGWTSLPGLAFSVGLSFASATILLIVLITTRFWTSRGRSPRVPQYQTLTMKTSATPCYGSCTSPQTERENSIISCAEKKMSRTEFFTVD